MKSFRELIQEANQGARPAIETSVISNVPVRRKRGSATVNTQNVTANPYSSSSTSSGESPSTSSRVKGYGDVKYYSGGQLKPDAALIYQKSLAMGPLNRPGVRATDYPNWPDPSARIKEIDDVAAAAKTGDPKAKARVDKWGQEFAAYQAREEGRRTRTRTSAAGQASDAKFRADLELDTPQGAQANRDVAKETQRLARQTAGERSLLAAINKQNTPVTVTPQSPLAPTKAQVAPKQVKPVSVPTAPKPQNINLGDTSLPKTLKAPKTTPISVKPKVTTPQPVKPTAPALSVASVKPK